MVASATFNVVLSFFAFDYKAKTLALGERDAENNDASDTTAPPPQERKLFSVPEMLAQQPAFVVGAARELWGAVSEQQ